MGKKKGRQGGIKKRLSEGKREFGQRERRGIDVCCRGKGGNNRPFLAIY